MLLNEWINLLFFWCFIHYRLLFKVHFWITQTLWRWCIIHLKPLQRIRSIKIKHWLEPVHKVAISSGLGCYDTLFNKGVFIFNNSVVWSQEIDNTIPLKDMWYFPNLVEALLNFTNLLCFTQVFYFFENEPHILNQLLDLRVWFKVGECWDLGCFTENLRIANSELKVDDCFSTVVNL